MPLKEKVQGGASALKKLSIWGTIIVLIIVVAHASLQCVKEKSLRPMITEVGERIASADTYIYNRVQEVKQNPDQLYYEAQLQKAQQTYVNDPNALQLEVLKLQSATEKFKLFMSKLWIWFDIIVSLMFLSVIIFLIYKVVEHTISPFTTIGNILSIFLIYMLLSTTFTFMEYKVENYDGKNYSDLPLIKQLELLNPIKGILAVVTNIPYIIGMAYDKVVIPTNILKESNNTVVATAAKIMA